MKIFLFRPDHGHLKQIRTRRVFNWKIAKGNQILISASVNTQEQNLQLKACSLNLPN